MLAGFDFSAQGVWAFARPGAPPLKANESLDDAGVVDGALLTLVSVSRTERYRPLVEDVIDAIAVLDESPEFDRTGAESLCRPGHSGCGTGDHGDVAGGVVTHRPQLVLAGGARACSAWRCWAAAMLAKNRFDNIDMAESLLAAAVPVLAGAAALAVPLPRGVDSLGAPQIAGAGAVVLLLTLATRGGPRKRAELASFMAVTSIAVTAAAIAYGYGWQYWVPAGAIAFGLIVVTNAAKLTVAVARIALPPIPAPGETVHNDELLDPVATSEGIDEESSTWQAIIDSVPDSAARLHERSQLAKRLLVGFVTAGALVLSVGAIARCRARTLLHPQPDRRRPGRGRLRVSVTAIRGALVCVGASGCGGNRADRRDREAVHVVPAQCVAGVEHLHRGRDRGIDHRRRDRRCAAGVAGDQADPRTDRRRGDRGRYSVAAVDRQRVRRPSESAVIGER